MNALHPSARPMLKVASNAFSEAHEVDEGTIVKLTPDRGFGFIRTNKGGVGWQLDLPTTTTKMTA